jgi:hypothetical protein
MSCGLSSASAMNWLIGDSGVRFALDEKDRGAVVIGLSLLFSLFVVRSL